VRVRVRACVRVFVCACLRVCVNLGEDARRHRHADHQRRRVLRPAHISLTVHDKITNITNYPRAHITTQIIKLLRMVLLRGNTAAPRSALRAHITVTKLGRG
jgi:hypothetical protein